GENIEAMWFMVKELNLDVDTLSNTGFTALHILAAHGCHVDAMRFLVKELGADINTKGRTPPHVFAQLHRSVNEMRRLHGEGPNKDATDFDEWTLLHTVALFHGGNVIALRFLMEKCRTNVDVADRNECTALHLAARVDYNVKAMRFLLDKGADVNA